MLFKIIFYLCSIRVKIVSWAADGQARNGSQHNFFEFIALCLKINSLKLCSLIILSLKIHLISFFWGSMSISCLTKVFSLICGSFDPKTSKFPWHRSFKAGVHLNARFYSQTRNADQHASQGLKGLTFFFVLPTGKLLLLTAGKQSVVLPARHFRLTRQFLYQFLREIFLVEFANPGRLLEGKFPEVESTSISLFSNYYLVKYKKFQLLFTQNYPNFSSIHQI